MLSEEEECIEKGKKKTYDVLGSTHSLEGRAQAVCSQASKADLSPSFCFWTSTVAGLP